MTEYLTFDESRAGLRKATKLVLDAEAAYERAIENSADAEAVYRRALAEQLQHQRSDGKSVQESETLARGECAPLKRDALAAAGHVKLAAERLEDARDSRRSLWRLIEWSARVATPTNGAAKVALPENTPSERWP